MDDKPSCGRPVLSLPDDADHGDFTADDRGAVVGLVRRWVRRLLPAECPAGYEMALVLCELVANASVHGGGGGITVSVAHVEGCLLGRLVHHRPPVGALLPRWEAVCQTSRLLVGEPVEPGALVESSRGLLVVWHLTEDFRYLAETERSVTEWEMPACGCYGSALSGAGHAGVGGA